MSILWFWLNLYSVNLCQATAVGPKKDKTTTKKPVHYDDDVLKVYYLKHIKDKFYFKKQKKKKRIKLFSCDLLLSFKRYILK